MPKRARTPNGVAPGARYEQEELEIGGSQLDEYPRQPNRCRGQEKPIGTEMKAVRIAPLSKNEYGARTAFGRLASRARICNPLALISCQIRRISTSIPCAMSHTLMR